MKDRLQIAKKNRPKVGILLLLLGIIILVGGITRIFPVSQLLNPFIAIVLIVFGILLIFEVNITFP
jgi:Na+/alanine symporter